LAQRDPSGCALSHKIAFRLADRSIAAHPCAFSHSIPAAAQRLSPASAPAPQGRIVMSVFDPGTYLILSAGVFAGAVVSGLVGFAFSAVACCRRPKPCRS
jgi:hypothetical protein